MTQADDLQRLVERIEAATGPDRELNADILRHLGWTQDGHVAFDPDGNRAMSIPDYVGSIDAAMTLVPEGAGLSIQRYWIAAVDGPVWSTGISTGGIPSNPRQVFESYDAANPALAITAAALRARIKRPAA